MTEDQMDYFGLDQVKIDRFWSKADIKGPDDCWEWTAYKRKSGYGEVHFMGSNSRAHRAAFFLKHEYFPDFCLHRCSNRGCVNPAHLYDGTLKQNSADRDRLGRGYKNTKERRAEREAKRIKERDAAFRELLKDAGLVK